MARVVDRFEFLRADDTRLLAAMADLSDRSSGWINLLPGIPAEEEGSTRLPSSLGALFGTRQAPVTMCTWFPAPRSGRAEMKLGIMHPRQSKVVASLRESGLGVPEGWRVEQDHPRRGLIVRPPADAHAAAVMQWAMEAALALALVPVTGSWMAEVHR
jgi:hypothetical protein